MLRARELRPGIHWVGALDPDRRQFDALTPLPEGTSYNSYVVVGSERIALIDTCEPSKQDEFFSRLDSLALPRLDLIVSNHAEQDHSGLLPELARRYPAARILATPRAKKMLPELLDLSPSRIDEVADGESLSLGDRTLNFLHAPWVHWPETMMTYVPEERLLFSCDLFGSHVATHDLYLSDVARIEMGAKRYFAEIMSPFRKQIRQHLDRLAVLPIDLIAPSHGPVHADPTRLLTTYRRWSAEEPEKGVLIVYTSMHGSTKLMVDQLTEGLLSRKLDVEVLNIEEIDEGRISMALMDAATLVIASPMVLAGPHPKAIYAAALVGVLRPRIRHVGYIGSFGWGGKLVESFVPLLAQLRAEQLPPVLCQGHPREPAFAALDELAEQIATRHAALASQGQVNP